MHTYMEILEISWVVEMDLNERRTHTLRMIEDIWGGIRQKYLTLWTIRNNAWVLDITCLANLFLESPSIKSCSDLLWALEGVRTG